MSTYWFLALVISFIIKPSLSHMQLQAPSRIIIRNLNELIAEFGDCFIHIILPDDAIVELEEWRDPVSVSAASQNYSVPSRHLRPRLTCRTVIVILSAYNETVMAGFVASYTDSELRLARLDSNERWTDCVTFEPGEEIGRAHV